MIGLLAGVLLAASPIGRPMIAPTPAAVERPVLLAPEAVLARYAAALAAHPSPKVMSFEYSLEQTGPTTTDQTHRVFRSGLEQRDEILTVDGKRLVPPTVRIFHGRRNRYTIGALAPSPTAYAFRYLGPHRDGAHVDYVFAVRAKLPQAFEVTRVTIDGASWLPSSISFVTREHAGSGTITFVRVGKYWVPSVASARATYSRLGSSERIVFQRYRFPPSLPPSTFTRPRPLPSFKPVAL